MRDRTNTASPSRKRGVADLWRQVGEPSRLDRGFTGILAQNQGSFDHYDALVGIVIVGRDHVAGGEADQQIESAGLGIGVKGDSGGVGRGVLLDLPVGGVEVGDDGADGVLSKCGRQSSAGER